MDLSALISEHYEFVFRRVYRFTRNKEAAEDIMQDAIIKVLRMGGPDDPAKFRQWFSVVAINTAKNAYRSRESFRFRVEMDFEKVAAVQQIEHDTVEYVSKQIMRQFVDSLPDRQKMAFKLRIEEDMTFVDVAELMNCCYDTAKANYHHAVLKLKRFLGP